MQSRLTVGILVLQAEGLVYAIRYLGFLFQTAPASVVTESQQITVLVSHFSRDADLVAVEVVGIQFPLRGRLKLLHFQMAFAYPSAQGVVGINPSFFHTVFFEGFGFNQLVVQLDILLKLT